MKILIINGSPRKQGVTAQILHIIEKNILTRDGTEVSYIHIADLNILPCNGCCSCYKTGRCYQQDDAEKLSEMIALSDGIVIGSPTYVSNISGQLKVFLDRGHFVIEQLLHNKYAIGIVTGENYGSRAAGRILSDVLTYSGAKISGKLICNLPFNSTLCAHTDVQRKACGLADQLVHDIEYKKQYRIQSIIHKILFYGGIKPFVKKKGDSYAGVVHKWNQLNI
ncbi:MAG: flavodoxin family protein [bacterium]|nr:flavodoxin family protein [bacterium]